MRKSFDGLYAIARSAFTQDPTGGDLYGSVNRRGAERAFAQYDQVEPGNRLVCEVLEQRWNTKLEEQQRIAQELDALKASATALTPADVELVFDEPRQFTAGAGLGCGQ